MQVSRNQGKGFAQRTRKNLDHIRQVYNSSPHDHLAAREVHVVTQLVNSLLGIVVVPYERYSNADFLKVSLDDIAIQDWPKWVITKKLSQNTYPVLLSQYGRELRCG